MWNAISDIADLLTIISAIVSLLSVLAIRSYYKKIVRQYSVERLTVSEQETQKAIEIYQQIRRIFAGDQRGVSTKKVSNLYLDISETLGKIVFTLPTDFTHILELIKNAKEAIVMATREEVILQRNDNYIMLDSILDSIYNAIKSEKETIQKQNMKQS